MSRQLKAFISYSRTDAAVAERLAQDFRVQGIGIWLDKWEMRVGESLIEKIERGIADHDFLIVLLSRASVESPWVQKELRTALMRELDAGRVVVLPALLEECSIPEFLKEKLYADFRTSYANGFNALVKSMQSLGTDDVAFDAASSVASEWGVVRAFRTARSGDLFLSIMEDSILRLWQAPDGRLKRALFPRREFVDACLAPSGALVVAGLRHDLFECKLLVFDITTGALRTSDFVRNKQSSPLGAVCGSDAGVITGFLDGTLMLTDYEGQHASKEIGRAPFGVQQLALADNESMLAVSGRDTGVCLGTLNGLFEERVFCADSRVYDVALSPTGETLACATSQGDGVFIFNTGTGEETFRLHTDQVSAVAFSQDGLILAAGDWDGGVYLYRAPEWQLITSVRAHRRMVGAVAFGAGKYLLTGGGREDPSIKIWDLESGRLVSTTKGHNWERGI